MRRTREVVLNLVVLWLGIRAGDQHSRSLYWSHWVGTAVPSICLLLLSHGRSRSHRCCRNGAQIWNKINIIHANCESRCVGSDAEDSPSDKYAGLSSKNRKICPTVAVPEVNGNCKCHRRLIRGIIDISLQVVMQQSRSVI
jgi:hypothetical protein